MRKIRFSIIPLSIVCAELYAPQVFSQHLLLPGQTFTIDHTNSLTVQHENAVTVDTRNSTNPLILNIVNNGTIQQITPQDEASIYDRTSPPPQNSVVYMSHVGPAPFTINLAGQTTAYASFPNNPDLDYYSPAFYLAGNTTLNHTGQITGDIQVNYTDGGPNNVRINLENNSRVFGNIFTTAIFGPSSLNPASGPLGSVQINDNYNTEGCIKGFSSIVLNSTPGSIININHEVQASQIVLQNTGTLHLNPGGLLSSQASMPLSSNLIVQGGQIAGSVSGNGAITFTTYYVLAGNISGPSITLAPGSSLTMRDYAIAGTTPLSLQGASRLKIYSGTLGSNVVDNGSGSIDIEGPFVLAQGVSLSASSIAINSENALKGTPGFLRTGSSNPITGFNSFTVHSGGTAVLEGGATARHGGTITNYGTLEILGGTYTAADLDNADRMNIRGGVFNAPIRNSSANSVLNIASGTFNGDLRNVLGLLRIESGSFRQAIRIDGGALTLANAVVTADAGLFNRSKINLEGTTTLNGNYSQSSGSTLSTTIASSNQYGKLLVNGNTNIDPGSILEIKMSRNATFQEGETLDIVAANGNGSIAAVTILAPENHPFKFEQDKSSSNLRLTAKRSFYLAKQAATPNNQAVAIAMENLRFQNQDPQFNSLISQLDYASPQAINDALTMIAPNHTHGIFHSGLSTSGAVIDKAEQRMSLGRFGKELPHPENGYSSGDLCCEGFGSYVPVFFTNNIKQKDLPTINGFRSATQGIGMLADTSFWNCMQLGIGAIYANSHVRTDKDSGRTKINSLEGLLYAGLHGRSAFIDGTFLVGKDWYHIRRELILGFSQIAQSKHKGLQYTAKIITGYDMPFCSYAVTPLLTYLYSHLHQNSFFENGFVSRFTAAQNTHLIQMGSGLKLSYLEESARYIPELHVLYLRDLNNPALQVTSNFTAGGPSFTVIGPNNPHKSSVNVGGSVTAFMGRCFLINGSFDFEGKRKYRSYSAMLRLRWIL